jgi:hypothetical protein
MPDANMLWIWLVCFTVFTLILGAGLQFYQVQLEMSFSNDDIGDPLLMTLRQGAAILIMLTFIGSAVTFLMGMIRWVGKRY